MNTSKKLFSFAKTSLGELIVGVAFGKFSKLFPVKKVYETKNVVAFWHPKPSYKTHILIVPKKKIEKLTKLRKIDHEFVNEVFVVAEKVIKKLRLEKGGYSLITNGGGKQEVKQLHFHLIAN